MGCRQSVDKVGPTPPDAPLQPAQRGSDVLVPAPAETAQLRCAAHATHAPAVAAPLGDGLLANALSSHEHQRQEAQQESAALVALQPKYTRVIWDIENIPIPAGKDAFDVVCLLEKWLAQRSDWGPGVHGLISCFCNPDSIPKRHRHALDRAGVEQIFSGSKREDADRKIIARIGRESALLPMSTTFVLITSDTDFAQPLRELRQRGGAAIVLHAAAAGSACEATLRHAATEAYSWRDIVGCKDANPRMESRQASAVGRGLGTTRPLRAIPFGNSAQAQDGGNGQGDEIEGRRDVSLKTGRPAAESLHDLRTKEEMAGGGAAQRPGFNRNSAHTADFAVGVSQPSPGDSIQSTHANLQSTQATLQSTGRGASRPPASLAHPAQPQSGACAQSSASSHGTEPVERRRVDARRACSTQPHARADGQQACLASIPLASSPATSCASATLPTDSAFYEAEAGEAFSATARSCALKPAVGGDGSRCGLAKLYHSESLLKAMRNGGRAQWKSHRGLRI